MARKPESPRKAESADRAPAKDSRPDSPQKIEVPDDARSVWTADGKPARVLLEDEYREWVREQVSKKLLLKFTGIVSVIGSVALGGTMWLWSNVTNEAQKKQQSEVTAQVKALMDTHQVSLEEKTKAAAKSQVYELLVSSIQMRTALDEALQSGDLNAVVADNIGKVIRDSPTLQESLAKDLAEKAVYESLVTRLKEIVTDVSNSDNTRSYALQQMVMFGLGDTAMREDLQAELEKLILDEQSLNLRAIALSFYEPQPADIATLAKILNRIKSDAEQANMLELNILSASYANCLSRFDGADARKQITDWIEAGAKASKPVRHEAVRTILQGLALLKNRNATLAELESLAASENETAARYACLGIGMIARQHFSLTMEPLQEEQRHAMVKLIVGQIDDLSRPQSSQLEERRFPTSSARLMPQSGINLSFLATVSDAGFFGNLDDPISVRTYALNSLLDPLAEDLFELDLWPGDLAERQQQAFLVNLITAWRERLDESLENESPARGWGRLLKTAMEAAKQAPKENAFKDFIDTALYRCDSEGIGAFIRGFPETFEVGGRDSDSYQLQDFFRRAVGREAANDFAATRQLLEQWQPDTLSAWRMASFYCEALSSPDSRGLRDNDYLIDFFFRCVDPRTAPLVQSQSLSSLATGHPRNEAAMQALQALERVPEPKRRYCWTKLLELLPVNMDETNGHLYFDEYWMRQTLRSWLLDANDETRDFVRQQITRAQEEDKLFASSPMMIGTLLNVGDIQSIPLAVMALDHLVANKNGQLAIAIVEPLLQLSQIVHEASDAKIENLTWLAPGSEVGPDDLKEVASNFRQYWTTNEAKIREMAAKIKAEATSRMAAQEGPRSDSGYYFFDRSDVPLSPEFDPNKLEESKPSPPDAPE